MQTTGEAGREGRMIFSEIETNLRLIMDGEGDLF